MGNTDSIRKGFDMKHLVVMALGNIIGSGIFLASGAVISLAGPSAILAYALGGIIMLLEVMFIAEMSIVNPAPGSFRVHASEIFGPGMGFVNGWMFWCSGVLGMASEVTAAAIFTSLWLPQIPLWAFCLFYSVIMTIINFKDARGLSKIEMWLASVKVITLIVFILFGISAMFGLFSSKTGIAMGSLSALRPFAPNGLKGLAAPMLIVLFSFTGTGIIGLAIAETNRPEKNVPPAIYIITASVVTLYVLSVLFVILLIPWSQVSVDQSPFVAIMDRIGIPFGGAVINFIVLSASLSGLNSAMYSASRMLYSLGRDRQAPTVFTKTNRNGVPVYALGVSSMVLMLTAVLSYILPEKVFIILTGASSFTAMLNWLTISVTHLFYRRKVLRERPEKLKYKVPGYPVISIAAVLLIVGVLFTSPLFPGQTVSLIGGLLLAVILSLCYMMLKKTKVL